MIRILLLDCSTTLGQTLKGQGFNVESGTVGFSTGARLLPSQVYEKDIFVYNPTSLVKRNGKDIEERDITDYSPEYSLQYLKDRILGGATFLIFVNRVSDKVEGQNAAYSWIPLMPPISFTKDKVVHANAFNAYPDNDHRYLAPIVAVSQLDLPVLQRVKAPPPVPYHVGATFYLFWNEHNDDLGIFMIRGKGRLIILPRFKSNEEIVETFLHRVVPKIYNLRTRIGLLDKYVSPAERTAQEKIGDFQSAIQRTEELLEKARAALAAATREKSNIITADPTAKQVLNYHDAALRQDDVALFYLYKVVEAIEHKYGGEADGIEALGYASEWKFVKKTANESYRDIRHAPKPGDVIKKWSDAEIKDCFQATEKIILAYFETLFSSSSTNAASFVQT